MILSIFNVREKIVEAIPLGIRLGISPAIGLMLMNIGLGSNVGVYAEGNGFAAPFYVMRDFFGALTPSYLQTNMGDTAIATMVLTVVTMFVGLFVILVDVQEGHQGFRAVRYARRFRDLLGRLLRLPGREPLCLPGYRFLPASLRRYGSRPPCSSSTSPASCEIGWFTAITLIITFCIIDMFDTIGTLVGTASRAGMVDEKGDMPNMKEALLSDAIGTIAGACTGTSTVTTFVESASGVEAGGRTGLTAVVTGLLFLACIFIAPIAAIIPAAATSAALIYVGILMLQRSEAGRLRRYGSDGSRGADAHRYAHLRLHRPRHRPGSDFLHHHEALRRQGQGSFRPDLRDLRSVPGEVLPGCVIKNAKMNFRPKEACFFRAVFRLG